MASPRPPPRSPLLCDGCSPAAAQSASHPTRTPQAHHLRHVIRRLHHLPPWIIPRRAFSDSFPLHSLSTQLSEEGAIPRDAEGAVFHGARHILQGRWLELYMMEPRALDRCFHPWCGQIATSGRKAYSPPSINWNSVYQLCPNVAVLDLAEDINCFGSCSQCGPVGFGDRWCCPKHQLGDINLRTQQF